MSTTYNNISELGSRANIIHKSISDYRGGVKDVFIYEDHRTILNILTGLKKVKQLSEPPNLIMFDRHDDYCNVQVDEKLNRLSELSKDLEIEKVNQFVEFELNPLDDDWVKAGMELGVIGDCILFNEQNSNIGYKEEYDTRNFGQKTMYNAGDIWNSLRSRGNLGDAVKSENFEDLHNALDWHFSERRFAFKSERKKFVLDFDLDCFTVDIYGKTYSLPHNILLEKLTDRIYSDYHSYFSSADFIKDLISDAEIITICSEVGCSGGIREAQKIFNSIDVILFDEQLGGQKF